MCLKTVIQKVKMEILSHFTYSYCAGVTEAFKTSENCTVSMAHKLKIMNL